MLVVIPFLSWAAKASLEIQIPDDTAPWFKVRAAVVIAIGQGANLRSANLSGADLSGADLSGANLSGANLSGADLSGADLSGADLSGANLRSADLRSANLRSADLRSANLRSADLRSANLSGANLSGANLRSADLRSAKNSELAEAMTTIAPDGVLVGWKKCRGGVIVQVMVPLEAKRSNATGRKCRTQYVEVLNVFGAEVGISQHDGKTEYRKGATVRCDKWCEDRWQECAGGIHFFLTRAEAEAY